VRFLFDQSADFRLIPHLTSLDHDVQAISREYPAGLPDEEVLAIARNEQRILVTADHDFGDLVFRRRLQHTGILLMRLPGAALQTKEKRLTYLLTHYQDQLHEFVVVTERGVRVRKTASS
jgi:predicted nuclease of predicted toxin-antitoxin system